jgi:hypothetical protein
MKIIDIGICIDNKDPRGFGRIRARNSEELDSTRANAVPYKDQWSKDDPFVYSPFLPNHINVIPQEQQAVKIVRYDDSKGLQNQEYIAGPFTTPHNFNYQNELSQLTETSLGQRGEKTPAIKSFTGDKKIYDDGYLRPESVGSLPKIEDVSLNGNYGSDVILTEHGVQLRAGILIHKNNATKKQKEDLELYPMYSQKHAKLSLKKFPSTKKLDKQVIEETTIPSIDIKHVFEYDVDSLTAPTTITYSIYRIERNEGDKYKSDVFNINTELNNETSKLIHTETVSLSSGTNDAKLQEAYIQIRDFISKLDTDKLIDTVPGLNDEYAHPFYFRPKNTLRAKPNSNSFLQNIVHLDKTNGFGFLYSQSSPDVQPVTKKVERPHLKKISEVDQSFAALTADKILYLSTSSLPADGKQIDFRALDKYEYSEEDYVMRIMPNTFSSVRGEKLIEILELITLILLNHVHGIVTPPKYSQSVIDELRKLISRAKLDMINSSIRIN